MSGPARLHAVLCAALLLAPPAFAADAIFSTSLDAAPMTMANRADVAGTGQVSAELTSSTLSIKGTFSGLSAPAMGAHLRSGLMTGVPGDAFADLTITQAASGTLSGEVKLTRAQMQSLKNGGVYVQIDSAKAPDGALRGWLQPPQQ